MLGTEELWDRMQYPLRNFHSINEHNDARRLDLSHNRTDHFQTTENPASSNLIPLALGIDSVEHDPDSPA